MTNSFTLPADTHIVNVHIRVFDLNRSLTFYAEIMGFKVIHQEKGTAILSANGEAPYLLRLTEEPDTLPRPPRTTGLYHIAIRLPDRTSLARLFQRLLEHKVPFHGAADHKVSEALYLADPDGNGLELYDDRPRQQWPRQGDQVAMGTDPLDLEDLLRQASADASRWLGINPDTDLGHIHLQVSDLEQTEAFYLGLIGMDVTLRTYPGALFLSAGGYHHHIGANVWSSRGAPPPPSQSAGLVSYSIMIPGEDTWKALRGRFREAGVEIRDGDQGNSSFLVSDPSSIQVEFLTKKLQ